MIMNNDYRWLLINIILEIELIRSVFAPRSGEGAEEGANQSSSSQMTQVID